MEISLKLAEFFKTYEKEIFRTVEGQYFIATRKLVDSDEEQIILEEIIDKSKPPAPTKNSRGALHYLLYTPFRYPPLKSGGRFHTRIEQSIFYGSEKLTTSMAEVAYRRFLFMQHTETIFEPMQVPYAHFVAKIKSAKTLLLTEKPFSNDADKISNPSSYGYSQAFGAGMRKAGVLVFNYFSARAKTGINVGLFSPEAFQYNKPIEGKDGHWSVYVSHESIEFQRAHLQYNRKESHVFAIEDFYVDRKFPIT